MAETRTSEKIPINPNGYFTDSKYIYRLGRSTSVYEVTADLIAGTLNYSPDRLKELDPHHTGRSFVFVIRLPQYMVNIANGHYIKEFEPDDTNQGYNSDVREFTPPNVAKTHLQNLKVLLTHGCLSYSGTPNLEMNTVDQDIGWDELTMTTPVSSSYNGTEFTLRVLETRNEPLRRALEYYQSGIFNPVTKRRDLHGALNDNDTMMLDPGRQNWTFDFMIINTDETYVRVNDISLWRDCVLKSPIDRTSLDWEMGQPKIVEPRELTFGGHYVADAQENADIWKYGQKLLETRLTYTRTVSDMGAEFGISDTTSLGYVDIG